ncbi:MAG: hypothetical protein R3325_10550 [Thermoanaerobaculia bacterium]|nr:hypothetical protein [Thermoanaerobaculia bacterium]
MTTRSRNRREGAVAAVALAVCLAAVPAGLAGERGASPPPAAEPQGPGEALRSAGAGGRALREVGHPTFLSPHAGPIAVAGGRVFVANTAADTLDVIDVARRRVVARVPVGVDPVGLAVRPDGREVWVANHVSDSVSVVDLDPESPTHLQVVATVQAFARRQTRFDEPVGVAFAGNRKAYVSLSSENEIAVVKVASRRVVRRLAIPAQDPRALAVRDGRLYVIPFESNNRTQLSGCAGPPDGELCTFDAFEHAVFNNNVLSLGIDVDIVKNPKVPDRDLFVFDTKTDRLVETVETVGTLLYGLAVDSRGRVFVAQTDARNDANGRAGTLRHGLAELENRPFLNRITRIDCGGGPCSSPEFFDLEPLPPLHPPPGGALATPFAIQVSGDDRTLVVSAAGSDRLFTVDAFTGEVLGRVTVDAVPRGIALEPSAGMASRAWVYNAVANTVSVVDFSDRRRPRVEGSVPLEDPTPRLLRRGRRVFHDAGASTTGTFSCESCHPDGHTDQLLWVLDTPVCDVAGCTQIPPRVTMPVRGLRDTAPYHWDGIPGDPFGGRNTANIEGADPPNCTLERPESCTRDLVDAGLATTMCKLDECDGGELAGAQRRDLARFLLTVPYPPAQRRPYTDVVSQRAAAGYRLFHVAGQDQGGAAPNVCGSCHRMPHLVSTNTPGTGMDAPTWRGAYDRWLILPQGRLNVIDVLNHFGVPEGFPERRVWRLTWGNDPGFDPVWDMVLEGSTGFSGAFARQVTLSRRTAGKRLTRKLLDALERAATEGRVVLEGEGVLLDRGSPEPTALQYAGGVYRDRGDDTVSFSREELVARAAGGLFVGTFTARAGAAVGQPQPVLWTGGAMERQSGPVAFPTLVGDASTLVLRGRHVREGAAVLVDGRRVPGEVRCLGGTPPACDGEGLVIELRRSPRAGMHLLQVQNPEGLLSNDFLFHAAAPPPSR